MATSAAIENANVRRLHNNMVATVSQRTRMQQHKVDHFYQTALRMVIAADEQKVRHAHHLQALHARVVEADERQLAAAAQVRDLQVRIDALLESRQSLHSEVARLRSQERARTRSPSLEPAAPRPPARGAPTTRPVLFRGKIVPFCRYGILPVSIANNFDIETEVNMPRPAVVEAFDAFLADDVTMCGLARGVRIEQQQRHGDATEHLVDFIVVDDILARTASNDTDPQIWLPAITGLTKSTMRFALIGQERPAEAANSEVLPELEQLADDAVFTVTARSSSSSEVASIAQSVVAGVQTEEAEEVGDGGPTGEAEVFRQALAFCAYDKVD